MLAEHFRENENSRTCAYKKLKGMIVSPFAFL